MCLALFLYMEREYIVNFSGKLRGKYTGKLYTWQRKEPFVADERDMQVLNERNYKSRPVSQTTAGEVSTAADVATVNVELRIEKRGGWYTLLKGDTKVFSSRDEEEVKAKKAEYDA